MNTPRVGGDVDAYCTRCRMLLGHTILAMVGPRIAKVRCNTCQGEHAYKPGPPGTPAPRAAAEPRTRRVAGTTTRTTARERAEAQSFEDQLAGRDAASATPYSTKGRFAARQLLHHPTFGLGVVQADRGDKVDVAFRAGVKTLLHGQGEVRAPVEFDKARRPATTGGAADKPPSAG